MKEKATKIKRTSDGMRTEYDFSKGVRGKYARRYHSSTNIVVLEPDVAKRFKNAREVNGALRVLLQVAQDLPARAVSARDRS